MASSQSLSQYREIIATLSGGEEVNEEALMTMWYSTNWIEILQPAPLSIALLGSVLCIASGTNDFSVFYKHPEGPVLTIFSPGLLTQPPERLPKIEWKHVKHPDSFKTCLMQVNSPPPPVLRAC